METQKAYQKYKKELKKVGVFSIVKSALTISIIVAWIFIPIFIAGETADFSMFDVFLAFINVLRDLATGGSEYIYYFLLVELFPALTIIMGAITITIQIKKLITDATNLNEKNLAIKYAQIKKTADGKERKNIFKQNTIFSFIFYYLFAIMYGKIFGMFLRIESHFSLLTGISLYIVFPALLFVAYCVISVFSANAYKTLLFNIISEDENAKFETVTEEKTEETVEEKP